MEGERWGLLPTRFLLCGRSDAVLVLVANFVESFFVEGFHVGFAARDLTVYAQLANGQMVAGGPGTNLPLRYCKGCLDGTMRRRIVQIRLYEYKLLGQEGYPK